MCWDSSNLNRTVRKSLADWFSHCTACLSPQGTFEKYLCQPLFLEILFHVLRNDMRITAVKNLNAGLIITENIKENLKK